MGLGGRGGNSTPFSRIVASALAARETSPFNIVVGGTSLSEAYPPFGVPANLLTDQGWPALMANKLRTAKPTTGAPGTRGYFPAVRGLNVNPTDWPVSAVGGLNTNGSGLGLRNVFLNAGGAKRTIIAPPGTTSVGIFWRRNPTTTSFNWSIDGGATTTVSTTGADEDFHETRVAVSGGQALAVEYVSGNGVFLDGFYCYAGDETKGIRVWDAARASSAVEDMIATPIWFDAFAVLRPQLVMLDPGPNEWDTSSPAQLCADVTTYHGLIAAKNPDPFAFLLNIPWQVGAGGGTPWDEYRVALTTLARTLPNCKALDWRAAINKPDVHHDTVGGLLPDETHQGVAGSVATADTTTAAIL